MERAIENDGPHTGEKIVAIGWMSEVECAKYRSLRFRFLSLSSTSLQSPIGEDTGAMLDTRLDNSANAITSAFEMYADPTTAAFHEDIRARVQKALQHLTPSQRAVIIMRFGLNSEQSMTLEEVGAVLGVTRERMRQIEVKALKRLVRVRKQYFQFDQDI